jgi:hypothetical protein
MFAECLGNNRSRDFSSEIKKLRHKIQNAPAMIDNCNDPDEIAALFATSNKLLYSSVNFNEEEIHGIGSCVDERLSNIRLHQSFVVILNNVQQSVKGLKHGKNDSECPITTDYFYLCLCRVAHTYRIAESIDV